MPVASTYGNRASPLALDKLRSLLFRTSMRGDYRSVISQCSQFRVWQWQNSDDNAASPFAYQLFEAFSVQSHTPEHQTPRHADTAIQILVAIYR
jgi:hypothetical protein